MPRVEDRTTPSRSAATPHTEVGRLLALAQGLGKLLRAEICRVDLHGRPGGRAFAHGDVIATSGRRVAHIGAEADTGYAEARAAWNALQPRPGVGVSIRSVTIAMDGTMFFA